MFVSDCFIRSRSGFAKASITQTAHSKGEYTLKLQIICGSWVKMRQFCSRKKILLIEDAAHRMFVTVTL